MRSVTILKLGGSVITDKSKECTPDLPAIDRIIAQIARFHGPLVLLHGGGSYAHPFVTRVGLQNGYKQKSQLRSISETELYLDQLTRIIGVALLLRERPFVPLRPMSFVTMNMGEITHSFLDPLKRALKLGLLPLIHGDLAFDATKGCGVISADQLASFLGIELNASRVLFGCDVDGVFSADPKTSPGPKMIRVVTRRNFDDVLKAVARGRSSDATGGMLGKVREAVRLARKGHESYIFNLRKEGLLKEALRRDFKGGTRFLGWN